MERTEVIFLALEGTHISFSHLKKEYVCLPTIFFRERFKKGSMKKANNLFRIRQQLLSDDRIENSSSMDGSLRHALSREEC